MYRKLGLPKYWWGWLLGTPILYAGFVLSFVWWHCYTSGLPGGKCGPLDAYRHTLASAMVSYTTSPKLVALTTRLMEFKNHPGDLMDQHNNAIGARIGQQVRSLAELHTIVKIKVGYGAIDAPDSDQITWLPPQQWFKSLFW